jgi:hypothetical protein
MGPKFLRLFLYGATGSASNEQWPLGSVGSLGVRVLGTTTPHVVRVARRDGDGTQRRIPWLVALTGSVPLHLSSGLWLRTSTVL